MAICLRAICNKVVPVTQVVSTKQHVGHLWYGKIGCLRKSSLVIEVRKFLYKGNLRKLDSVIVQLTETSWHFEAIRI